MVMDTGGLAELSGNRRNVHGGHQARRKRSIRSARLRPRTNRRSKSGKGSAPKREGRLALRRKSGKPGRRRLKRFRKRAIIARSRKRGHSKYVPSSTYDWLFHSPSANARMRLDRAVWLRLRNVLPPHYSLPDRNFISIVRARAGLP